jgi:hypothetical protein
MLGEAANPELTRLHTFSLILVYSQTIQHNRKRRPRAGIGKEGAESSVKICLHGHLPGKHRGTPNALEWNSSNFNAYSAAIVTVVKQVYTDHNSVLL